MRPLADKKFEKRDLEWTKSSKTGPKKCSPPSSPSVKGDPSGAGQKAARKK